MEDKKFWRDIQKVSLLIGLIIILVGWGVTWGVFKTKVEMQDAQLKENKTEIRELKSENNLMYKELKTNVEQNKENIAVITAILELD